MHKTKLYGVEFSSCSVMLALKVLDFVAYWI
jgi:hypothetical protein